VSSLASDCAYCKLIESNPDAVYEDEHVIALVPNKPWVKGHMIVLPKVHAPIFERLEETVVEHLFAVANKLSIVSIQSVQAPAASLVINNGVGAGQSFPHVMLHVLPRSEGDGLSFSQGLVQLPLAEATELSALLKSSLSPQKSPVPDDPDWWIIDQLTRIP